MFVFDFLHAGAAVFMLALAAGVVRLRSVIFYERGWRVG